MKNLPCLCWEASLAQEELEEVFNKDEEQRSQEGGVQDTPKKRSLIQSTTNMPYAFDITQNHGLFDPKDAMLLTGYDSLNKTLTAITNATLFNKDKLDIQIQILQNLATTTMAIDNKLDRLNLLIKKAQASVEADKEPVNQAHHFHCSPILDKL
ncbi:hypothetical protein NDU88_008490 [Pleurodeles waltl]|uniref:Uncharacterized protein n=1 Tax=Pleurodeles waltl TaxID=8319 RepID=A0AAV7QPV5_PLEWA|nr:hypothetical protein NDU88_008490 [Pleurodeles waltl]